MLKLHLKVLKEKTIILIMDLNDFSKTKLIDYMYGWSRHNGSSYKKPIRWFKEMNNRDMVAWLNDYYVLSFNNADKKGLVKHCVKKKHIKKYLDICGDIRHELFRNIKNYEYWFYNEE